MASISPLSDQQMQHNETQRQHNDGNKEQKSIGNKYKSRSVNPVYLHSDNMKENIPGTNTWNDRDDITTVIKQMIREYCEPHAKKFDHLDKMEKLS